MFRFLVPALIALSLSLPTRTQAADIRVVATIKPLHSLVAQVIDGIASPELLIKGAGSPHDYALRPSDARMLADADVIFWIGPGLETFLARKLPSLPKNTRIVQLGPDGHHDHGHGHKHEGEHNHESNPHIWLNPERAADMIEKIADVLAEVYPEHAARMQSNREGALLDLRRLNMKMSMHISAYADAEIVVLHDAYSHFTEQFGLKPFTALSLTPEHQPGAKRVAEIRDMIKAKGVKCVFAEPQFSDKYMALLLEDTDARVGTIDPLGAAIEPGPDLYDNLMGGIFTSVWECLSQS